MKCKHIWAVEMSNAIKEQARPKIVLKPVIVSDCPVCNSNNIQKKGIRHNKCGVEIQKYKCLNCGKYFGINVGFERMKHNPKAMTAAMQLYFSGESLRNTMRSLELIGTQVSHQTVANWIEKYTAIMKNYADTKYKHDARRLFKMGSDITGKRPETLITDGLPAYRDALIKNFIQTLSRNPNISTLSK